MQEKRPFPLLCPSIVRRSHVRRKSQRERERGRGREPPDSSEDRCSSRASASARARRRSSSQHLRTRPAGQRRDRTLKAKADARGQREQVRSSPDSLLQASNISSRYATTVERRRCRARTTVVWLCMSSRDLLRHPQTRQGSACLSLSTRE